MRILMVRWEVNDCGQCRPQILWLRLEARGDESVDPVIARLERGRREVLRLIKQEATESD